MRQSLIQLGRSVAFCGILLLLLLGVDFFTRPTAGSVLPWAALEETEGEADVLVLGSSRAHTSVLPMELWRQKGIAAVDVTAGGLPIDVTLGYLKQALKTEEPELVIIDVSMFGRRFEDLPRAHNVLDDMPMGVPKVQAVMSSISPGHWFEFLFPLQIYHSRWSQMAQYDYLLDKRVRYAYIRGALYLPEVQVQTGEVTDTQIRQSDYLRDLPRLRQMLRMCESRGTKVLLSVAPCFDRMTVRDQPLLERLEADLREEFPSVTYLDMNTLVDSVGVDPTTDYKDATHLNHRGAVKLSKWLADYLASEYGIEDRRDEEFASQWNADLVKYDELFLANW